jgi:hypothetical protein
MDELEEQLEQMFPSGPDDSVEWLCYCLSPYQMAILHQMLELNASDTNEDKQGVYRQRQQRVYTAMLKSDEPATHTNNIKQAQKFINEHQIW